MSEVTSRFLIGRGELLTREIPPPKTKPAAQAVYTFDQAKARLLPELRSAAAALRALPADARPGDLAVVGLTLHPQYLARSYFPSKALLLHLADDAGLPRRELGWGRLPADVSPLITCAESTARVVYQGELKPGKYMRAAVPLPPGITGTVTLSATLCYASSVDPEDAGAYTPRRPRSSVSTQHGATTARQQGPGSRAHEIVLHCRPIRARASTSLRRWQMGNRLECVTSIPRHHFDRSRV